MVRGTPLHPSSNVLALGEEGWRCLYWVAWQVRVLPLNTWRNLDISSAAGGLLLGEVFSGDGKLLTVDANCGELISSTGGDGGGDFGGDGGGDFGGGAFSLSVQFFLTC